MYHFLWIFFIYAFLGWCTEVSYAALQTGKFVNRGFLNGPVCPIYGFGVVIVLTCLTPLKENFFVLFMGSVLLTSLLELVTGFVLEKIFHQRWWDYSNEHFNIGGYICLRFSLAWGLACLIVVDVLHPTILWVISYVPYVLGVVLLSVFGAVMAVDLVATVRTIAKINRQLGQIDELAGKIREASNEFGENLADKVLDAAEKGAGLKEEVQDWKEGLEDWTEDLRENLRENLDEAKESIALKRVQSQSTYQMRKKQLQEELERLRDRLDETLDGSTFGQRRLMNAFPKMRSVDHSQALERLRRRMDRK